MTADTRLHDLLSEWENLRKQGHPASAEELCRDCPELRNELERHIQSLDSMNQLLHTSQPGQTHHTSAAKVEKANRATRENLKAGAEAIPGYQLLERLGEGGYGEVWKATAPGGFHVALKFIPLATGGGPLEQRSLSIIKGLRHPNLLTTFGSWQTPDFLVIAMELADRTLGDRYHEAVAQGFTGIPRDELLEYFQEAAKGIDYLNEPRHLLEGKQPMGVQHRDIKPQNILLVGNGVKVADFGLARLLEHTVTSHTGSLTPSYAAPEFFQGHTSSRSDQYCLAVTYCHLRGGRVPFTGDLPQIIAGHMNHAPDLTMLPEAERSVIERALAKNPLDRWPSCRAFVKALADCTHAEVGTSEHAPQHRPSAVSSQRKALNATLHPGQSEDVSEIESLPPSFARPGAARSVAPGSHRRSRTWIKAAMVGLCVLVAVPVSFVVREMLTGGEKAPSHKPSSNEDSLANEGNSQTPPTKDTDTNRRGLVNESLASDREKTAALSTATDQKSAQENGTRDTPPDDDSKAQADVVATADKINATPSKTSAPSEREAPSTPLSASTQAANVATPRKIDTPAKKETETTIDSKPLGIGELARFEGHTAAVRCVAVATDRRHALSGGDDQILRLWDLETAKELDTFEGHRDVVHSVAFSHDGRLALSGGEDQAVRLWDVERRQPLAELTGHTDTVFGVAFSAESSRAVSVGKDTTVRLWDVANRQELHQTTIPDQSIRSVTFAGDLQHGLTASDSPVIRWWNLRTGAEVHRFADHRDVVWSVAFSTKGSRFLSAGGQSDGKQDYALRLWSLSNSQPVRRFPGHTAPVGTVAFSPDGHHALSGSEDSTVRFWDVETGNELQRFTGHTDIVFSVAFSPDGRRAVSASKDKTVRVWRLPK